MKKKSSYSAITLALTAAIAPAVLVGMLTVSAASESSSDTKSTYHNLFDAGEFRSLRRKVHEDVVPTHAAPTEEPATVNPCDSTATETETKATEPELTFEDLDMNTRRTLLMQLRIGGCPANALKGYKDLCEKMLKAQGAKKSMKGLVSPEQ
jgi:hypothetical protein